MIVAAASAWSQCTFRTQSRVGAVPHAVQHGVAGAHGEGRGRRRTRCSAARRRSSRSRSLTITKPLVGAATTYFVFNTLLVATAIGLSTRQPIVRVWNENFLWSAPSYFVGALARRGRGQRSSIAAATGWRRSPRRRST